MKQHKKQHNWMCPECGSTKRAPKAPRMNDVRRYCLPCSESTGYLVERTAPALVAKRKRKEEAKRIQAARKAAQAKTKREKERAARLAEEERRAIKRAEWEARQVAERAEQEREEARRQAEIDALDPDVDPFSDPNVVALRDQLEPWRKGTRWCIGAHRGAVVVPSLWELPEYSKHQRVRRLQAALSMYPPGSRHGVRTTTEEPFLTMMTPTEFCDWAIGVLEYLGELPTEFCDWVRQARGRTP